MLAMHRYDPSACGFPPPRVPVLPPPRWRGLHWRAGRRVANVHSYARARYALATAYRLAGVGAGGALLAPAYHCRTMLDAALALGAPVALYAVQPDLGVTTQALDAALDASAAPARALLVAHPFGIAQPLDTLRAWCDARAIALIEDCSHACVTGPGEHAAMGKQGDYVVASPYKFFPSADGGLLWSAPGRPLPEVAPAPAPLPAQARAWASTLAQLVLPTPHTRADNTTGGGGAKEWIDAEGGVSAHYVVADAGRRAFAVSEWIVRHTRRAQLAQRRRRRFVQWLAAVAGLPGCRALYPALPEGCVPYMFPLLLDQAEPRFGTLKRLGLPIWRWDEMAVSDCPVAAHCRLHLLHLPCHQALSDAEMDWMIDCLSRVLRGAPA